MISINSLCVSAFSRAAISAAGCWFFAPLLAAAEIDFNRDIRPILSDKCIACHGPDASHREADLRLDEREAAIQDRGGYSAVVPGDATASLIIERILSFDPDEKMPPPETGKELTEREIELLRAWIDSGAEYQPHWAYVAPVVSSTPEVRWSSSDGQPWQKNWIDDYVLRDIRAKGLKPSSDADKVTLIRRLSFDLLGLPPTAEQVQQFTADTREDAVQRLVDTLLESQAFGERMAMYWLDLVRYADTVGYHGDQDHNISPYRDYVIDAFNRNLPFDQFTCEQLAGDLLPDATIDQKIATGYNRLLQTTHEGGLQPKEYLAIYAADRVRNVSAVWLGGTLGCAQCHDHKFDPFTARDFYSMAAFFADVDEDKHFKVGSNSLPTARPPEIDVLSRSERERLATVEDELKSIVTQCESSDDDNPENSESLLAKKKELEQQRDLLLASSRKTMITVAINPRTIRILPRGNWQDESGEIVSPSVPEFLGKLTADERRLSRLDLAKWLTDSNEGIGLLTARVFVNRWWYLMFGEGLSRSLEDFGGQGQSPTHPELLDRLAHEYVESGWNTKHIIRLIATSRTYQQTSEIRDDLNSADPENKLFARQSRYRLPAETIRDNALAVSGLLVDQVGGGSVKPYQPPGYYKHLNFPVREYHADKDDRQWRRGVYVHWQRQFLHPMLKAFDAPTREECTAQRSRSNTPLAALTLLNDPSFVEAARAFAARVMSESGRAENDRLGYAYQAALSRTPDKTERDICLNLLHESFREFSANQANATKFLSVGDAKVEMTEVDAEAELAAWTTVCRAILNTSEFNTRN